MHLAVAFARCYGLVLFGFLYLHFERFMAIYNHVNEGCLDH
jgi:hypothetical protein